MIDIRHPAGEISELVPLPDEDRNDGHDLAARFDALKARYRNDAEHDHLRLSELRTAVVPSASDVEPEPLVATSPEAIENPMATKRRWLRGTAAVVVVAAVAFTGLRILDAAPIAPERSFGSGMRRQPAQQVSVRTEQRSSPAPPSPTAIAPEAVTAAADAGLLDAGLSYQVALVDGTLNVTGVVAVADVRAGYFTHVAEVRALVADAGTEQVAINLALRGDEAKLRERLHAIAADGAISFASGSAELTDGAVVALDGAAAAMLANPGLRILVAGHTDPSGSAESNALLAQERAGAVVQQLVERGIPITRLQVVAYGELFTDPEATDAANRRVEFEVAP